MQVSHPEITFKSTPVNDRSIGTAAPGLYKYKKFDHLVIVSRIVALVDGTMQTCYGVDSDGEYITNPDIEVVPLTNVEVTFERLTG